MWYYPSFPHWCHYMKTSVSISLKINELGFWKCINCILKINNSFSTIQESVIRAILGEKYCKSLVKFVKEFLGMGSSFNKTAG